MLERNTEYIEFRTESSVILPQPDVRPVKSLKSLPLVSDSPMPWGRRVRKLCRAAAEAGSPGGCIPRAGEAWRLRGPGSGPCSPAERPGVPAGRSGTGFPGDIPLSPEEEAEEGSWVGCPERAACPGVGVRWGPAGRRGTEEAAWSDGQSHRDLRDEEKPERVRKDKKKKTGRRGNTNRKGRGRTRKEADYLTRAVPQHVCPHVDHLIHGSPVLPVKEENKIKIKLEERIFPR